MPLLLALHLGKTLNDGVTPRKDVSVAALAFELSCEKNDCCPDNCDISSFTFHFPSSLFAGSQCRSFYEQSESAAPHFPSLE